MMTVVELCLRELLEREGMSQAALQRQTGLSEDRIGKLCRNQWAHLTRVELGLLIHALKTDPAALIRTWSPNVFFGALGTPPLTIHLSARATLPRDGKGSSQVDSVAINERDMEAFKLIYDYALGLGVEVRFELHTPQSMSPEEFARQTATGSHLIIGSPVTGQMPEYAVAEMYGVSAFDTRQRDLAPFSFSWVAGTGIQSSFGFDGATLGLGEGIYSNETKGLVAQRTHNQGGDGLDCGLIVVERTELPPGDDNRGIRKERCVIVLAGHGRLGTLGYAKVLIDKSFEERLYPAASGQPRMFVVQAEYFRRHSIEIEPMHDFSVVKSCQIVAEG